MEALAMLIKERLSALIEATGMNVQEFEKGINKGNGVVGKWISGKTMPKADSIYAVSKFCGVSADYILGLSDEPNAPSLESLLSDDERLLIEAFRMADADGRQEIIFACRSEKKKAEARLIQQEGKALS